MRGNFYFDTSIWLDFFEDRNEPNFPKSNRAKALVSKIIKDKDKIFISEVVKNELIGFGFSRYDIDSLFLPLQKIIVFIYSTKKQFGKAKDISKKRDIPLFDALHALIARDNNAIMVTRDKHFDDLLDISKYKKPEELI